MRWKLGAQPRSRMGTCRRGGRKEHWRRDPENDRQLKGQGERKECEEERAKRKGNFTPVNVKLPGFTNQNKAI